MEMRPACRIVSLPSPAPRSALEGTDDLAGYPAAVKVAGLGLNLLVVHPAAIDLAGVEGQVVLDRAEGGRRVGIGPGRIGGSSVAHG